MISQFDTRSEIQIVICNSLCRLSYVVIDPNRSYHCLQHRKSDFIQSILDCIHYESAYPHTISSGTGRDVTGAWSHRSATE